jgi:hypothetical protein
MPEQTHDDYEWLNEEDGEEDVPRNGRDWDRGTRSPAVGQHQRRRDGLKDNPDSYNRSGECRPDVRVRGVRLIALGGCAARIGLCLREDVL